MDNPPFVHFTLTSKMGPIPSWSLPAAMCQTGQSLRRDVTRPNVCRACYAQIGPMQFPNTQELLYANWEGYAATPEAWVKEISRLINTELNCVYFRLFSSGDAQSSQMFFDIDEVAARCKNTFFWLPTQEHGFLAEAIAAGLKPRKNLNIRLSRHEVDSTESVAFPGTTESVVVYHNHHTCPAHKNNGKCGACRACWNKKQKLVAYPLKVGDNYWPLETAKRLGLV